MKQQKFSFGLWLLLGLVLVIGTTGLCGCDRDEDDFESGVYQGFIEEMDMNYPYYIVKITNSPYKMGERNNLGEVMPHKYENLRVKKPLNANFNYPTPTDGVLLFRVKSPECDPDIVPGTNLVHHCTWDCEIEILKVEKDDDFESSFYEGFIDEVDMSYPYFWIKVTHSPYKAGECNSLGEVMPHKYENLRVKKTLGENFDYTTDKLLSFRVKSPEYKPVGVLGTNLVHHCTWDCEIEILKVE